jgi:hypothetical protein
MRVETRVFGFLSCPLGPYRRGLIVAASFAALAACSTDPKAELARTGWVASQATVPMDSRQMASDARSCEVTAKSSQGTQADSFSDPRYGAVNAMADALRRDSIDETSVRLRQSARFELCMQSRGWKR